MRMTIKLKLAAAFIVIIAIAGVGQVLALRDLGRLNASVNDLVSVDAKRVRLSSQIMAQQLRQQRAIRAFLLEKSPEDRAEIQSELDELRTAGVETYTSLMEVASDEGREILSDFAGRLERMNEIQDRALRLARAGQDDGAFETLSGSKALWLQMQDNLRIVVAQNEASMDATAMRTDEQYSTARMTLLGVLAISTLFAAGALERRIAQAAGAEFVLSPVTQSTESA